jgi:predicted enzyme related to lactoylglutathione lyase
MVRPSDRSTREWYVADVSSPNTLIFIDFPTDEPARAAQFYRDVFGWEVEPRPEGVFYRIVPGSHFPNNDGSPSEVGNLHLGIYETALAAPDPRPAPVYTEARRGPAPRIYILVGDDDNEAAILARAEAAGAEILWRDKYWAEFNGYHGAFRDPWGSEVILWSKGGDAAAPRPDQADWQAVKGYAGTGI